MKLNKNHIKKVLPVGVKNFITRTGNHIVNRHEAGSDSFGHHDLSSVIIPAVRAHAVRHFRLPAIGTRRDRRRI